MDLRLSETISHGRVDTSNPYRSTRSRGARQSISIPSKILPLEGREVRIPRRLLIIPVVAFLAGAFISFGIVNQLTVLAEDPKHIWDVGLIPGVYALDPSLSLDSAGNPGIAFYNYSLGYAYHNGSSWSVEIVDPANVGDGSSIAFDAFDRPHISYYTGIMASLDKLKYAHWDGTKWIVEFLESMGLGPMATGTTSLVLDSFGRPHIAYLRPDTNEVRYTRWTGSMWE